MKTSDAYKALAHELESFRQLPTSDLVALVGTPVILRNAEISGEQVELELAVMWLDNRAQLDSYYWPRARSKHMASRTSPGKHYDSGLPNDVARVSEAHPGFSVTT